MHFFRAHSNYIFTPQKLQEHTKLRRVAHIEFSVAIMVSPGTWNRLKRNYVENNSSEKKHERAIRNEVRKIAFYNPSMVIS